jgi:FMN phosphatase YigB (HAD superfamily)
MASFSSVSLLVFDVGETLVGEERLWATWADWLGVSSGTFHAALGAVIAGRRHHEEAFRLIRPGIDMEAERLERSRRGIPNGFLPEDLYPDTVPTLRWARERGFRIGFAGNHSQQTEAFLRALRIEADLIGSSESWGVSKPDPAFFQRIVDLSGSEPGRIAYIGDRIDNDILPALRIGMRAVFVERGPWGVIQARWPEAGQATHRIRTLGELPALLEG